MTTSEESEDAIDYLEFRDLALVAEMFKVKAAKIERDFKGR